MITRFCLNCKKGFCISPSRMKDGGGKYCSKTCYATQWLGEKNPAWKNGISKKEGYRNVKKAKRRALEKRVKGNFTAEEWISMKIYVNYMCLICRRKEPEIQLTVDHILPLRWGGHNSIDNIQPVCRSCNSRKGSKITGFGCPKLLLSQYGSLKDQLQYQSKNNYLLTFHKHSL